MNTEPGKFEAKLGGTYPVTFETHGDMIDYLKKRYSDDVSNARYGGYGKQGLRIGGFTDMGGGSSESGTGINP